MSINAQKTIFITASRGFIVRNILRSGVLDLLKQDGFRVVVFFCNPAADIPQKLRDEFEDGRVILENARCSPRKPGHVRFAKLTALLVFSKSTWHHSQMGNKTNLGRAFFWKYLELVFSVVVSRFGFLKTVARYAERKFFTYRDYQRYFDTYNPSIVFSTSIVSGSLDIEMMKEAKARGIATISMPKGWDNITKALYRFVPDVLVVQNEYMKRGAIRSQGVQPEKIVVTGFPQFDWYRRPEILQSREEYCASIGFEPKRKIIFFGSEGRWAPNGNSIVSLLADWVQNGSLVAPCSLFVRPHFSDAGEKRFDAFKNISPHIVIDESFTLSDFFSDNWDPGVEETKKFINLIYHMDVLVTVASTLTLDAACFNKPIINIIFNVLRHPKTGRDISHLLYTQDHYDWVFETNAIDLVRTKEELHESINRYIADPSRKSRERIVLRDLLCERVDGRASERLSDVIRQTASQSFT